MDNEEEERIENENMESADRNPPKKESLIVAGNICSSRIPLITNYFRVNHRKCP